MNIKRINAMRKKIETASPEELKHAVVTLLDTLSVTKSELTVAWGLLLFFGAMLCILVISKFHR